MLISWSVGTTLILAIILLPSSWTIPLPQHYQNVRPQNLYQHHDDQSPSSLGSTDQLTREQSQRLRMQYLKQLEAEVIGAVRSGSIAQTVQLEQRLQDEILSAAVEALASEKDQSAKIEDLQQIDNLVKRDKRAVEVLSSLLGGSSGNKFGGGGGGDGSGGSGSGTILNLVGPLLGSSSGGGGTTGGDGGDAGSGSGSILNLLGPLLGSSSGGGGGTGGGEGESSGGGGSDSGAILNLLGPLLGSSSGTTQDGESGGGSNILSLVSGLLGSSSGGGGAGNEEEGNGGGGGSDSGSALSLLLPLIGSSSSGGGTGSRGGGDASGSSAGGSDSGSILNLVGPLLGSSSGGGSSGGGDASSAGGGGSGLGDILGLSNSSGGGGGGGGSVNGAKVGIVQQKLQLFLRLKFALFTKMLNTLTSILGSSSAAKTGQSISIDDIKYPDS
ncbi:uncharacterized protein LOC142320111 isoform X1 [Lycorma delicatula]|uniref:uncharacterized protein LOC142320111 isoform X1 n=1 Tax=Lycorma delicatula TaxID=130591 RepID=UPI003F510645